MAFEASLDLRGSSAVIRLQGELDAAAATKFRQALARAAQPEVEQLVVDLAELTYLSSAGLRGLVYARQKMGEGVEIVLSGASEPVAKTIKLTGFDRSVIMSDRPAE
jgi:anti-anti-sigma factor